MLTGNMWLKGLVGWQGVKAPGTEVAAIFDPSGGLLFSGYRGQYAELVRQGRVFYASNTAVTLPVNAATLVSLFGVYNPPGSSVNLELIEANVATVVATTVVDAVGLYYSIDQSGATFTTQGSTQNRLLAGPSSGVARFYSSVTVTGTPLLACIVGGIGGAVTNTALNSTTKDFAGAVIVPPGTMVHLAMTTAASTASGITLDLSWAEIPL